MQEEGYTSALGNQSCSVSVDVTKGKCPESLPVRDSTYPDLQSDYRATALLGVLLDPCDVHA